jgi:hypothetical protein
MGNPSEQYLLVLSTRKSIEVAERFIPDRANDSTDIMNNAAGALLVIVRSLLYNRMQSTPASALTYEI